MVGVNAWWSGGRPRPPTAKGQLREGCLGITRKLTSGPACHRPRAGRPGLHRTLRGSQEFKLSHYPSFSRQAFVERHELVAHFSPGARHLSASSRASDETWRGGRPEARLTCLSLRCLSSYLFFSASSSD